MPDINPTDPALALSTDGIRNGEVGRLYRRPGTTAPELRTADDVHTALRDGVLVPSVTNVIGAIAKPHLIGWAAREAAKEAVYGLINRNERLLNRARVNPTGAVKHYSDAATRIRDNAGSRGSNIHLATELIGRGLPITHLELTADESAAVDKVKEWLDRFQPDFKHLEVTGFSTTPSGLGQAGTSDFIADINGISFIGDWKCVTDDTPVLRADGSPARAADLKEGEEVLAWSPERGLHPSPLMYVGDNGTHAVITVSTSTGHKVTTTHNHPFWVSLNNKAPGWVTADNIEQGDQVYVPVGWNHSPERRDLADWEWNRYLSPYLFGILWSLTQYSKNGWTVKNLIHELPKVSRDDLTQELRDSGFIITKAGKVNLRRGLEKIARKHDLELGDILDVLNSPELPSYLYGGDSMVQTGFVAGVREVFANRDLSPESMFLVFRDPKAHMSLQQYLTNAGHVAHLDEDDQGREYMRVILDTNNTMKFHGTSVATVTGTLYHQEPAHTIALEVAGSHTHVTGGIITHNTNRRGLHAEVSLQLAANANATELVEEDATLPMVKVEQGLGVHISPQGVTAQLVEAGDPAWDMFCHARETWEFMTFHGYAHGTIPALGRVINDPKDL